MIIDQLNFTNTIKDFTKMCIWFYLFTNHGSKFTFWPRAGQNLQKLVQFGKKNARQKQAGEIRASKVFD